MLRIRRSMHKHKSTKSHYFECGLFALVRAVIGNRHTPFCRTVCQRRPSPSSARHKKVPTMKATHNIAKGKNTIQLRVWLAIQSKQYLSHGVMETISSCALQTINIMANKSSKKIDTYTVNNGPHANVFYRLQFYRYNCLWARYEAITRPIKYCMLTRRISACPYTGANVSETNRFVYRENYPTIYNRLSIDNDGFCPAITLARASVWLPASVLCWLSIQINCHSIRDQFLVSVDAFSAKRQQCETRAVIYL